MVYKSELFWKRKKKKNRVMGLKLSTAISIDRDSLFLYYTFNAHGY